MLVNIIQIGNSRGLRIPKTVLSQCSITDKAEMEVEGDTIIIKPLRNPRMNWEKAMKKMRENRDDSLIVDDALDLDDEEWSW